ncbi:MAG: thermonuclease family protein [bacterium]|nr:thermonuclease family protein [bacterium]MCY3962255.1 thermonuclease family protein [bacterium]MCY4135838.1 thermonuclease family protein [bacterium]
MRSPAAVSGLLVGGLFLLVGCSGSSTSQPGDSPELAAAMVGAAATVMQVVDGDTVVVQVAGRTERVRLIGIDTPETIGGFLPAECYGDEATVFTKSLLPEGTEVRLTRDAEARDRYDRLLAYVHRSGDGLFVNLEIAANGYAEALVIEPNTTHADAFYAAAANARDQGLGLWSKCGSADVVLE